MFCKRSFTSLRPVENSQEPWNPLRGREKFRLTKLIMTEICFFFHFVSNNPDLRQQRDKIWQLCRLVARIDTRIGFLNREVGSSFY